jgi:glutathione synthase/RimK-type ligase-like ATP-grasp enzyme
MRLAILTPAPENPRFGQIAAKWTDRLAPPLRAAGFAVEARPWTDPGDLSAFDAVTPLLAWGYHLRPADWWTRLDRLEGDATRTLNSVDTLRWNSRKTYLAQLEAAGAPIVPTLFVDRLDAAAIAAAHAQLGDQLIAKPQVSGGSHQTVRLSPGAALDGGPDGAAMLQPFLPAVSGEGELSLFYFGGQFSHAVGKVAQAGDFRVQFQYGGKVGPIDPAPDALAAAALALAAAGRDFVYVRVDLIRMPDGRLVLMELEATEPDLYLEHASDGGAAFAQAMADALQK